jgi:hypothetical protein
MIPRPGLGGAYGGTNLKRLVANIAINVGDLLLDFSTSDGLAMTQRSPWIRSRLSAPDGVAATKKNALADSAESGRGEEACRVHAYDPSRQIARKCSNTHTRSADDRLPCSRFLATEQ